MIASHSSYRIWVYTSNGHRISVFVFYTSFIVKIKQRRKPLLIKRLDFVHWYKAFFIICHFIKMVFAAIPAYHFKAGEVFSVFKGVHGASAAYGTSFWCEFRRLFSCQ